MAKKKVALSNATKDIINFFNEKKIKVFSFNELRDILYENIVKWKLSKSTTLKNFIEFLMGEGILKLIVIDLPKLKMKRYTYGEPSIYEIAFSINKQAYFSHYTALFLHNLTNNIPKNVYINYEQAKKMSDRGELTQENINKAFSRPMRITNQIAAVGNQKVYLLNGKNVGRLGVEEYKLDDNLFPVTGIERTLIDITIRPNYAGGVQEVFNAYLAAKGKVSVNRLVSILNKMDYIYPYYQAIGFYLEKAGYKDNILKLLERFEMKYNFYLTYEVKETEYSSRWKLYYPRGF
ncbi:MAG: hypothetical protein ABRQ39_29880 [Candidatus Eremiobacterota bacterium]